MIAEKKLKIAFLTSTNARDKKSWSGIHYYMAKSLEKNVGIVDYLGPVNLPLTFFVGKVISFLAKNILGKRFDYRHNFIVAKAYAMAFRNILKNKNYDIIFAPTGSSKIAFLETKIPIVYLSDATYASMVNYYEGFSDLLDISLNHGNEIEKRAIQKAAFLFYPSQWAADSAIKDYHADKSKVHIIPFGANIDNAPKRELLLKKRKTNTCRLLFLGVDWHRKGGELAFNCMKKMNEMGVNTELTVCGCVPPEIFINNRVNVIPFINKNDKNDYKKFEELLLNSDFLILPTKAECFGIVFCEASAYGVPSIANDTGGVSGVIKNMENGYLLPSDSSAEDYAKFISGIFCNDETYYSLVKKSRDIFEAKLNWDAWAAEVKKVISPVTGCNR